MGVKNRPRLSYANTCEVAGGGRLRECLGGGGAAGCPLAAAVGDAACGGRCAWWPAVLGDPWPVAVPSQSLPPLSPVTSCLCDLCPSCKDTYNTGPGPTPLPHFNSHRNPTLKSRFQIWHLRSGPHLSFDGGHSSTPCKHRANGKGGGSLQVALRDWPHPSLSWGLAQPVPARGRLPANARTDSAPGRHFYYCGCQHSRTNWVYKNKV